jgi:deoxyribonuclease-4
MRVGAHVSVAGGMPKAFSWYDQFDCESLQVFTKSQLQWAAKPLDPDEIYAWLELWEQHAWPDCFVHNSYLINLATPDETLREKSVAGMVDELERAAVLGIPWVNTHPGSSKDAGRERGLDYCVKSLQETLTRTEGLGVGILLENTAGMGNCLGGTFDELAYLLQQVNQPERMGVCFDTCHGFASGYDLRSEDSYQAVWQQFDERIGLDALKAFHLNDSLYPLNSHRDRHAEIGKGQIGVDAFRFLMNDPRFAELPGVTELADDLTPVSIERLKSLRANPD